MSKEYEDFGEDEFLDGAAAILENRKNCFNCKHLYKNDFSCKAFPEVIPEVFITGRKQHTRSSKKYGQKNNIVWEYDKNQTWIKRQWARDKNTETKVIECGTDQKRAIRIFNKLDKEGWNVRVSSWETFPQEWTIYANRKKKK